jgi:hypothetical protein
MQGDSKLKKIYILKINNLHQFGDLGGVNNKNHANSSQRPYSKSGLQRYYYCHILYSIPVLCCSITGYLFSEDGYFSIVERQELLMEF